MKRICIILGAIVVALLPLPFLLRSSEAQTNVVAFLTVDNAGVEMQRANTDLWVPVRVESVIGGGDRVRTNNEGRASISFFGDDLMVEIETDTEVVITQAITNFDGYQIAVEIVQGQTRQMLVETSDANSTYEFKSPVMSVILKEGEVEMMVEEDGSTAMLTESGMAFSVASGSVIEVKEGFGLRGDSDGDISAVLPVRDFDQLDTAIDGLSGSFTTEADVLLNVRQGPSRDNNVLGTVSPGSIDTIMGVSDDGSWYRIPFRNNYGWISGAGLSVDVESTRLVVFAGDYVEISPTTDEEGEPNTAEDVAGEPAVSEEEAVANQIPSIFTEYNQEELNLIAGMNEWRLSEGLAPFHPNATLTRMARDQAAYLISLPSLPNDIHADAQGRQPRERAISDDYRWPYYGRTDRTNIGENGYVGASVDVAINWWSNSEIHNSAATNAGYREIGVAAVPHPWGFIYITVFGSRPNKFPIIVDQNSNTMYIMSEQYRFASGGDWLTDVQEIQFVDSVLTQLDDAGWIPYSKAVEIPRTGTYAVALRGDGKTVIGEVDTVQNILIVSNTLPDEPAPSTPPPTPSPTPQPAVDASSWDFLFPTNTPAP